MDGTDDQGLGTRARPGGSGGPTWTSTPEPDGGGWGALQHPIEVASSLLVLLGAGLYATIRFGQQAFYNRFGVRPEEVGQTYAASLSRAAVVIVALLAVVGFSYAGARWFERAINPASPKQLGLAATVAAVFVPMALMPAAAMWLLLLASDLSWVVATVLIAAVINLPMLWSVAESRAAAGGRELRLPLEMVTGTPGNPMGILVRLAVLFFGLLLLSGISADRAANRVFDGERLAPDSGFGLLGLQAESVVVIGELPESLDLSNRDVMYLGQADGTAVLYDMVSRSTIRAPSDGIAVVRGSHDVQYLSLRPEQDVDLDRRTVDQAGRIDPFRVELSWRDDRLLLGPRLASTSLVRAGIVDDALSPSRDACTSLRTPFEQLKVDDLRWGLRFCVHTTTGRWVLLTVTDIEDHPRRVSLEAVSWPA